jgi:spore germination protein
MEAVSRPVPVRRPLASYAMGVRLRIVVAVVAFSALVGVGVLGDAGWGVAAPTPLAVLGFQSEGSPPALIDRNARAMTLVGVDGVDLTGPGRVSAPDQAARRQLARSHAEGLPAVLLVDNWSDRVGDFYEPLAHATLDSSARTAAATSALARDVRRGGWNGVSVDLESLAPRDRAGLTAFVSDLRADLPKSDSLTVCVTAFTSLAAYRANGYDLAGLARSADQIVLMTYDDHGPWENTPGPIGPLPWQRASVRALERVVSPRQVFLGVADYAYAWRPHSNLTLTVSQARALVARRHAQPRWVSRVGEWTARLSDGSTVWWSDARSIRRRIGLARTLGVHGIAVWSLGTGDPLPEG